MSKRFYVQRQHIIASLDILLYQLHAVSFFTSPSIFLAFCRLVAQFICSKPRQLDTQRGLRFFYATCMLLNLPSMCVHFFRGVAEGRAIILDFVGMSCRPSRFELCSLDLSITLLQLLLLTISYETSVYSTTADATDVLLPQPPESPNPTITGKDSSTVIPPQTSYPPNMLPVVIDLRLNSIAAHFYHAPFPSRRNRSSLLPLPNTSPLTRPGMERSRAGRSTQTERRTAGGPASSPETRMPGAIDTTQDT